MKKFLFYLLGAFPKNSLITAKRSFSMRLIKGKVRTRANERVSFKKRANGG